MKKLILLTTLLLLCSGCAGTITNKVSGDVLYGTALGTLVIDWGQTRSIAKQPATHSERNLILGKHPQLSQVDAYFPVILGLTAVSYPLIKEEYRLYVYGIITALEAACASYNLVEGGLHMDFVGLRF